MFLNRPTCAVFYFGMFLQVIIFKTSHCNMTVKEFTILKIMLSNGKFISKGPAPKRAIYFTFNFTNQPVGFFGTSHNSTVESLGVL